MRVLLYAPLFWPEIGGIEIISTQLLAALTARGHQFVVITAHGRLALPDQMDYQNTPIYRFPMLEALQNKQVQRLVTIQRTIATIKENFQPDLIHLHLGGPTPIVYFHLQTAQIAPAPILVTAHNCFGALNGNAETLLGSCLRTADSIVAGSDTICAELQTAIPGIAPRITTLCGCLPLSAAVPAPLDFANPRLLYVGRLTPEKGVDLALAAFQRLADDYPRLTLVIAGDGPTRAALEEQVQQWNLADRVCFLGNQPWEQISALLNTATIVVMPSRWREPFGLVALEAAQMARPVIATAIGGLPEIIIHRQTGYLVEPENPSALAAGIAELLAHPSQTQQMGQAARQRALTCFAWEQYVDAYEGLYQRLVD